MNQVKSLRSWIAVIVILLLCLTSAWLVLAEGETEENATYQLHSEAIGASEMKLWLEVDSKKSVGITTYQMKLQLSEKEGKVFSASEVAFDFAKADDDTVQMNWADYDKNTKVLTLYAAADTNMVSYQQESGALELDLGTVKVDGMKNTDYQITVFESGFQIVDLAANETAVANNNILITETNYDNVDNGSTEEPGGNTPGTGETNPNPGGNTPGTGETNPNPDENTPGTGETNPNPDENTPGTGEANPNPGANTPASGQQNNNAAGNSGVSVNQGNQSGTNTSNHIVASPSQSGNSSTVTLEKPIEEANVDETVSSQTISEPVSSEATSSGEDAGQNQSETGNTVNDTDGLPTILVVICVIVVLVLAIGAIVLVLKRRK